MSHRVLVVLATLLAGGLAIWSRLSGFFAGWDTAWQMHLGVADAVFGLPLWLELICDGLFAAGTAAVALEVTSWKSRLGLICATGLQPFSALAVGVLAGVWISPFPGLLSIFAAWAAIQGWQMSKAGQREKFFRQLFGRHLSAESLRTLLQQPDALRSTTLEATVLSARLPGQEWERVEAAARYLQSRGAWVEVQTDNRLLAVWNTPLAVADPATSAVEAVLGLEDGWQVGVASGCLEVELEPKQNKWQMRGTAFAQAEALNQANATFGSRILLDLATNDLVSRSVITRPVDLFVQPGAEWGLEIFEPRALLAGAAPEMIEQRDRFWEAVIFYRQKRFAEALQALQKAGQDPVVEFYRKRLENLQKPR